MCIRDSLQPRHPLSGGTAILVHRRISYRLLPPVTTTFIEGCAVAVDAGDSELRIVPAYLRPGLRPAPPPEEWDTLHDYPILTIAVCDFNAKHPSWNSRTTNAYGNSLRRFGLDNPERMSSARKFPLISPIPIGDLTFLA